MSASALGLIGDTPVVRFSVQPGSAAVWAKVESRNPGGSVKDRIALAMIEDARERGLLRPGQRVVEATSGNTGIGLAVVCAARGYPLTIVIPESVSSERIGILEAMGAHVVTTDAAFGIQGSIDLSARIAAEEGVFWPRQFENRANPAVHERTTGPEIVKSIPTRIDSFVAGVGTGGTITGVGRHLRGFDPDVRLVAVEPAASPVLSGGKPGPHRIQGIGAGFVPPLLELSLIDTIELVTDHEAWDTARAIAHTDGLFVGISSGAAAAAAFREAMRLGEGANVVTLLPDGGERYLSVAECFSAQKGVLV